MSDELFFTILDQLRDFDGIIHPYFRNEPLLDKRLVAFCAAIRERTRARISIQTNGSLLTHHLAASLARYATVIVNDYSDDGSVSRRLSERELPRPVILTRRASNSKLSNRAGNLPGAPSSAVQSFCVRPFDSMTIGFNGRAVLCCQDWTLEEVVGDLRTQSLEEIWAAKPLQRYRHALLNQRREGLCERCDFPGV